MELDELKNNWKQMESGFKKGIVTDSGTIPSQKGKSPKSKALTRFYIGACLTFLCLSLLATSPLWAPLQLPDFWLLVFCIILLGGTISELYVARTIREINLCESTHSEVLASVIKIKNFYKKSELYPCIIICVMLFWLSFLPPVKGTFRAPLLWIATPTAMLAEYLWYRKNIKEINKLYDENTK